MTPQPLSIVVPALNEERHVPALLELVRTAGPLLEAAGFELAELIVVDDGSTDRTAELVLAAADARVRLIRLGRGRGKGAAVREGVLAAVAPFALVMDADLATPIEELVPLAAALEAGADIAIGSRGLDESTILVRQARHRELAGKTFNRMVRVATGLPYRDTQCGFKLFRLAATRILFERQRIAGFASDVEILAHARRRGLSVAEVPVRWTNDPETRVRFLRASERMARDLLLIARRYGRSEAGPASGPAPDTLLGTVEIARGRRR